MRMWGEWYFIITAMLSPMLVIKKLFSKMVLMLIFHPNFPGLACCDNVDIFTDLFSLGCWWRKSPLPWGLIVAEEGAKAKNYCDTESLQTLQSYVWPGHRHLVSSKPSHWPTWMSGASDWPADGFLLSSPRLKSEPNIGTLLFLAQLPDSLKVMSGSGRHQWTVIVWTFWILKLVWTF